MQSPCLTFSPNSIKLQTKAGKLYFINQVMKFGVLVYDSRLVVVDEAEGKAAIQDGLSLGAPGTCSSELPTEEQLREDGLI